MVQDAAYTYHQRLWRSSMFQKNLFQLTPSEEEVDLGITEGSLSLFESVETLACLNILSSVDKMPADAYENALAQLKNLKQFLTSNVNLKDKKSLEVVMLIAMARQLLNASAQVIPQHHFDSISTEFSKIGSFSSTLLKSSIYSTANISAEFDAALDVLNHVIKMMQDIDFNAYYSAAVTAILDSVRHLRSKDHASFFTAAGKARVLLGLAFVSCYIPDYPVDPTSEPRLHVNLLTAKKKEHVDNIEVRTSIEKVYTGNTTNQDIKLQQAGLDAVNIELAHSATIFSLRPAQSQLDDIFVDLRYLQKSMLDKNVESLLNDLEANGVDSVLQREALLQGNALQFVDRVHHKFPLYRDILQPLVVAVDDIKYGLRILTANARKDAVDHFLSEVIELLVRDPDVSHHAYDLDWHTLATPDKIATLKRVVFERAPTSRKWAFYLRLLIVILQRLVIGVNTNAYIKTDDLIAVNVLFSEIIQVWKSAEEYKRKMAVEKEALFKTRAKKYEPPTDEELEQEDLNKIFANFNQDFADLVLEDDGQEKAKSVVPNSVEEESVLDDEDIHRIGHLHRVLFETYSRDACVRSDKSWDRETIQSYA
ncbi:hypothetical protein G6F42_020675 [Rhizopus arrhizus]|nr:hypothetical protein G6F42_020675 [Rhizopus arrhizus]